MSIDDDDTALVTGSVYLGAIWGFFLEKVGKLNGYDIFDPESFWAPEKNSFGIPNNIFWASKLNSVGSPNGIHLGFQTESSLDSE